MSANQLGPIGQVSRIVSDIDASVAWYRDVLGLTHLHTYGDLAFFDCGGMRLFLTQRHEAAEEESVLYFRVDDIEAAHKELTERGVVFIDAPHIIHGHEDGTQEWMAFFSDPEGRLLALMSQVRG